MTMELTTNNDSRGRKTLKLDETTDDRRQHWHLELQSGDFPSSFENTNAANRKVNLKVISADDFKASDNPNSFLIPLVLIATARGENNTIQYFRGRYESRDDSILNAKISASITLDDNQSDGFNDPHLLITFETSNQSGTNEQQNGHQFGNKEPVAFVNRVDGENSMGGVDIPRSKVDTILPTDKVVQPA